MCEQWVTIIAAIIGGLLAGGTGWFITLNKDKRELKRKTNLFTSAIKNDLERSKILYKKVIEEWGKNSTVWLDTLGEIEASREIYNLHKEWILIYHEKLQNKIFDYYYKSNINIHYLRYLQNRKTQINITAQSVILDLKIKDPSVTPEQIDAQVINVLGNAQHFEHTWINEALPKKVDAFRELVNTIENILIELDKIKV